jgi:GTPase
MTKEHIGISMALKIPFFIVVTKIDLAPQQVYLDTLTKLCAIMRSPHCGRMPIVVDKDTNLSKIIPDETICPIFSVSSVSPGVGIEQLKHFMYLLPLTDIFNEDPSSKIPGSLEDHIESQFMIDSAYNVTNVGLVVGGTITKGQLDVGHTFMMGPDKQGHFKPVVIKGIHENRT